MGSIGISLATADVDILLTNMLVGLQTYLRSKRDAMSFCVLGNIHRVCCKLARL
jgi:hypothetical protein